MTNKQPGVAFYGKVRIPTIGHRTAIDQAKGIAKKVGGKLTIGLSGTSEPLDMKTKKSHAEKVFGHPVDTGTDHTRTLSHFLTHLNKSHDELHLVAGSDRVEEYKSFIHKYNGKANKKGEVPFNFKRVQVHAAGGERTDSGKDPRKMSHDELVSSVSASKLEKLAKEGKYDHFKAYHPGMPESHVRRVYSQIRRFHGLNENIDIGLPFARSEMPQIGAAKSFIKYLKDNDVKSAPMKVDPDKLKSSQMEFDNDKVQGLRDNPSSNPIIVSNDNHVIDGHHRWIADKLEGRPCNAYVCDLPVLDLMYHAKHYSKNLTEEVTRKELAPMLDAFVSFASDKLGIKSMPKVRYKTEDDNYNSFAAYNPASNELSVQTKNRHPMDVFRSVAHELVHHKQNEDGRIGKDIAREGETGSDIENEANSEAGKIMRWFAKTNPDMFSQSHIVEETLYEGINDPGRLKAIFLAGGPGSGKDYVMNSTLKGDGLREINSDVVFEYMLKKNNLSLKMPDSERAEREIVRKSAKKKTEKKEHLLLDNGTGIIVNGTADDVEKIKTIKQKLEYMGYETMMVFVNTSDDVSKARNVERGKLGGRKVPDGTDDEGNPNNTEDIRSQKWKDAQKNIGELQKVFGNDRFTVIDNSADVRKVSPEEKERVQNNFNRVRRMAQQFVRSENKNPKAKQFIGKEMEKRGVTQYSPPRASAPLSTKSSTGQSPQNKPGAEVMLAARRLGLSYYGFGRFGRKVNGKNTVLYHAKGNQLVRNINEGKKDPCWKDYQQVGMKMKNGKKVPNCVPVDEDFEDYIKEPANREFGTTSLANIYKQMTPGQLQEAKKKKFVRKKLAQEDRSPIPALPNADGIGPEISQYRPMTVTGFTYGMSESIVSWVNNPKTQAKFIQKYGNLAEQKLEEAAKKLEDSGCGCSASGKKSVKEFYDASKAAGIYMSRKDEIEEDWQEVNRKDKTDGLSQKAVNAYRRENPGSKLQTAVTEKKPKGKRAKRRLSFCRRMKGMKKRLTSAETARDPDSRINKALRRWNCEE